MEECLIPLRRALEHVDELRAQVGGVQNGLVRVEERLTGVEGRLTGVEGWLTAVEGELAALRRLKRRGAR